MSFREILGEFRETSRNFAKFEEKSVRLREILWNFCESTQILWSSWSSHSIFPKPTSLWDLNLHYKKMVPRSEVPHLLWWIFAETSAVDRWSDKIRVSNVSFANIGPVLCRLNSARSLEASSFLRRLISLSRGLGCLGHAAFPNIGKISTVLLDRRLRKIISEKNSYKTLDSSAIGIIKSANLGDDYPRFA